MGNLSYGTGLWKCSSVWEEQREHNSCFKGNLWISKWTANKHTPQSLIPFLWHFFKKLQLFRPSWSFNQITVIPICLKTIFYLPTKEKCASRLYIISTKKLLLKVSLQLSAPLRDCSQGHQERGTSKNCFEKDLDFLAHEESCTYSALGKLLSNSGGRCSS